MKQSNKQYGFSAVEIILVVAVLGLVGFIGYTVWSNQQAKEADTQSDQSTEQKTVDNSTPVDPGPTEVITGPSYTSTNKKYKIELPDGWKFRADNKIDALDAIGLANITYQAGTPAQVTRQDIPDTGGPETASFTLGYVEDGSLDGYFGYSGEGLPTTSKDGTFQTNSNVEVQRYKSITDEDGPAPKGTIMYGYFLRSGDKRVVADYRLAPGEPDQLTRVEEIIRSIEFL